MSLAASAFSMFLRSFVLVAVCLACDLKVKNWTPSSFGFFTVGSLFPSTSIFNCSRTSLVHESRVAVYFDLDSVMVYFLNQTFRFLR